MHDEGLFVSYTYEIFINETKKSENFKKIQ